MISQGVSRAEDLTGESRRKLAGMVSRLRWWSYKCTEWMANQTPISKLDTLTWHHQNVFPASLTVSVDITVICQTKAGFWKVSTFLIKGINITDAALSPPTLLPGIEKWCPEPWQYMRERAKMSKTLLSNFTKTSSSLL